MTELTEPSLFALRSSCEFIEPHSIDSFEQKKNSLTRGGRKLTYDWHREIKVDAGQLPLQRRKGEPTAKRHLGYVEVTKSVKQFCTGSTHEGNYNSLGFAGLGEYVYPHGVKYEGFFKNGNFHGEGTLTYPMGQQIDGTWKNGRLINFTFRFADGLEYSTPWKYCQQPDRRCRSSATILVDAGGDITALKRHGGWKSTTVAEGYIDESVKNKTDTTNKISSSIQPKVNQTNQYNSNVSSYQNISFDVNSIPPINLTNCSNITIINNYK